MKNYPITIGVLLLSVLISLIALGFWEYYCRSEGFVATPESDKHLWAEHYGKLRDNDPEQVVLISASRGHFDFQLKEWEEETGIKPVQLGAGGRGPAPGFEDIVQNTEFNGTVVMNITPGLFFTLPEDSLFGWFRGKEWLDHYYNRTYADILNHQLSYLFQPYFAFLTSDSEGDPDLKSLIDRVHIPGRAPTGPPFPRFAYVDADRNTYMMEKTVTDTAFAKIIQNVWIHDADTVNQLHPYKDEIFAFYKKNIDQLKARGGKVIFTRNPSHGRVRELEIMKWPRNEYFDEFIREMDCPGYHFEDYPQLDQFYTPEWSHLSTPDARIYTREILRIMKNDGVIQTSQPKLN